MGFHDRYKFYHSLGNAPGFINDELRLFNYYLYANSFTQPPVFAMILCEWATMHFSTNRNPTTRTIELPD